MTDDIEISSNDSDREDSDEEISNKEKSVEENSNEENLKKNSYNSYKKNKRFFIKCFFYIQKMTTNQKLSKTQRNAPKRSTRYISKSF